MCPPEELYQAMTKKRKKMGTKTSERSLKEDTRTKSEKRHTKILAKEAAANRKFEIARSRYRDRTTKGVGDFFSGGKEGKEMDKAREKRIKAVRKAKKSIRNMERDKKRRYPLYN